MEEEGSVELNCKEPYLLESEIKAAIMEMKKNKAEGLDEFWKEICDKAMNELIGICRDMYEEGVWPTDFTRVVMIPLQKKAQYHRPISLISHASKNGENTHQED